VPSRWAEDLGRRGRRISIHPKILVVGLTMRDDETKDGSSLMPPNPPRGGTGGYAPSDRFECGRSELDGQGAVKNAYPGFHPLRRRRERKHPLQRAGTGEGRKRVFWGDVGSVKLAENRFIFRLTRRNRYVKLPFVSRCLFAEDLYPPH